MTIFFGVGMIVACVATNAFGVYGLYHVCRGYRAHELTGGEAFDKSLKLVTPMAITIILAVFGVPIALAR